MPNKELPSDVSHDHYDYNEDDAGAGDVEIDVEEYLNAARRPIEVTRRNKIICTTAFCILIVSIIVYVSVLVHYTVRYKDIAIDGHFSGPTISIYILMFTDVVASIVGIWTCLKKTGPAPMIYACVWLLLSSLVNICVTISLTFETKSFRDAKTKRCNNAKGSSDEENECTAYDKITVLLWCSLLFLVFKITSIVLCRYNYPQVFNWMMGKDVYIDEELIPVSSSNKNVLSRAGTLGTSFFDPPDIARIAARGSLRDGAVKGTVGKAIFVTRDHEDDKGKKGGGDIRPAKRRSTFLAI